MEYLQLKKYIKLFLEGNLSLSEEIELLEWINLAPENRKYFCYIQQTLGTDLKIDKDQEINVRWQKFLQHVNPPVEQENPVYRILKRYYRLAAPLAAAFLIGFVIAVLILWNTDKPVRVAAVEQKISTPYGARTQFVLPDSSIVWLNSGSELLFFSQFDSTRSVTLSGEGYFKVKEDEKPFLVSTVYGDVEVKGTSFNVKAYHDDLFETTLVSGEVNVSAEKSEQVVLRPGYQAVYKGDRLKVNPVETALYTSWTEGKLIFRKEYLPQLAKRLERWYNVKIEIESDPRLKDIHYSGTIEMETFSEVLNLLSVTAPVDYNWDDKTRIIRIFYKNN